LIKAQPKLDAAKKLHPALSTIKMVFENAEEASALFKEVLVFGETQAPFAAEF